MSFSIRKFNSLKIMTGSIEFSNAVKNCGTKTSILLSGKVKAWHTLLIKVGSNMGSLV